MSFDSLTVAALADQLNREATPSRIQRVIATGPAAFGFELYTANHQRVQLLVSAHADSGRVLLTNTPLTRDPSLHDSPLLLLLRKYVRGGRLLSIEQPGLERVLIASIAKTLPLGKLDHNDYNTAVNSDDSDSEPEVVEGQLHTVRLVIEVMSRHSNLILVDEAGQIIESLKRIPASQNRFRTILPHHPYIAPPMQDKADFLRLDERRFAEIVATALEGEVGGGGKKAPKLQDALVAALRGISPQLAREIVYRTTGTVATPLADFADWPRLYTATTDLFSLSETGGWQPCVVYAPAVEGTKEQKVTAYAPYELTHLASNGSLESVGNISAAIEAYYLTVEQTVAHDQLKEQLRRQLEKRRDRLRGLRYSLQQQLNRSDELELARYKGDAIFAYGHALEPRATLLRVPAPDGAGEIEVKLDPRLTPVENAQAYFKDYRKLTSARKALPARLEVVSEDLAYLDEIAAMLDFAQGYDDITLIAREVADVLKPPKPEPDKPKKVGKFQPKKKEKDGPPAGIGKLLRVMSPDGIEIYVGKSVKQNDYLTFKLAVPDDIWLHARGVRGAHVIVRMKGLPSLPLRTLQYAAGLAAGRSEARTESHAEVQYAQVRHLRRPKGGTPGAVLVTQEQTIRVAPVMVKSE